MTAAAGTLFWKGPRAAKAGGHVHAGTIARILGDSTWSALPERVKARFSRVEPALYLGRTRTRLTALGRMFAWGLLPFGAPLPVCAGESEAKVLVRTAHGGMSWTRVYRGPLGLAFRVQSVKRLSEDGRLLECCAGGWTMLLDVFAGHRGIVFRSCAFYWRCAGLSLPVPVWLTPGVAEVRHEDLGEGRFRFTLCFDHPWFGRTLFQDGEFLDPEEQ